MFKGHLSRTSYQQKVLKAKFCQTITITHSHNSVANIVIKKVVQNLCFRSIRVRLATPLVKNVLVKSERTLWRRDVTYPYSADLSGREQVSFVCVYKSVVTRDTNMNVQSAIRIGKSSVRLKTSRLIMIGQFRKQIKRCVLRSQVVKSIC